MRKFLLGAMMIASTMMLSAQEQLLLINEDSKGLQNGMVSIVDLDNDGKPYVIFTGQSDKATNDNVYIFKSNGDGTFTSADNTYGIKGGKYSGQTWTDVNGDGLIDLFTSGIMANAGGNFVTLLTNNGNGTFKDNWEMDLPQNAPGSFAADFDNDGIVDLMIYGEKTDGVLLFRNADGSIDETINILPEGVELFGDVDITPVDINNDGYLDFYLCGYVHDAGAKRRHSALYINNGDRTFTETNSLPDGISSNVATFLFADINGDGYMDMVQFGHEGSGSMYIYLNIEGEDLVEIEKVEGIYQTKNVLKSGVLADINNDGYYDLVANVYNGMNNDPRERLFFFIGDGNESFELNEAMSAEFMGGSNGSVAVFDCNGDGVLDFAVTGYNLTQNNSDAFCAVYKNTTYTATNEAPSAPADLKSEINENDVTLSWSAASDDKTPVNSLSYNLYLKNTETGVYYRSPLADLETGRRQVYQHGNAYLAKSINFHNLPDGEYEWSVQAIDAAYAGGVFAPMAKFTIGEEGINTIAVESVEITVNAAKEIVVSGADTVAEINVYDISGKLIQTINNQSVVSYIGQSSGVYIVKVTTPAGVTVKKVSL